MRNYLISVGTREEKSCKFYGTKKFKHPMNLRLASDIVTGITAENNRSSSKELDILHTETVYELICCKVPDDRQCHIFPLM